MKILEKLAGNHFLRELRPFLKLYIKRYNKDLIKKYKGTYLVFPIGAIVVHKQYGYLRFVTDFNTGSYFRDSGSVFITPKNMLCPYIDYEIV